MMVYNPQVGHNQKGVRMVKMLSSREMARIAAEKQRRGKMRRRRGRTLLGLIQARQLARVRRGQ